MEDLPENHVFYVTGASSLKIVFIIIIIIIIIIAAHHILKLTILKILKFKLKKKERKEKALQRTFFTDTAAVLILPPGHPKILD